MTRTVLLLAAVVACAEPVEVEGVALDPRIPVAYRDTTSGGRDVRVVSVPVQDVADALAAAACSCSPDPDCVDAVVATTCGGPSGTAWCAGGVLEASYLGAWLVPWFHCLEEDLDLRTCDEQDGSLPASCADLTPGTP